MSLVDGPAAGRTTLLIVRAWRDDGDGFRARVTRVGDVAAPRPVEVVVTSAEEVCAQLRSWLDSLLTE